MWNANIFANIKANYQPQNILNSTVFGTKHVLGKLCFLLMLLLSMEKLSLTKILWKCNHYKLLNSSTQDKNVIVATKGHMTCSFNNEKTCDKRYGVSWLFQYKNEPIIHISILTIYISNLKTDYSATCWSLMVLTVLPMKHLQITKHDRIEDKDCAFMMNICPSFRHPEQVVSMQSTNSKVYSFILLLYMSDPPKHNRQCIRHKPKLGLQITFVAFLFFINPNYCIKMHNEN